MAPRKLSRKQLRVLGILPLAFFSAQAIHYWEINELGHAFWMCNIGNLLLALGLFFEQPLLMRVAIIWMVPGVAVWFFYVVPTWGMLFTGRFDDAQLIGVVTSSLAHLGGFAVGLVVLRQIGMDARAWFYAYVWYFVVQMLSRLTTPAAMNVNLSHSIQSGWEQTFSSYWKFWLVLSTLVGLCLWILGQLLKMIWPAPAPPSDADGAPIL
ncbi:MAG TPA: hypothetical protein VGO73_01270 [Pyrinomonadaceae bacterium]|nr:hypothetical protein [Pyrinomonadaceae bacterium]